MTIKYLLFVAICLGIARDIYAVDLTLKPGETSDAVIDATIRLIRNQGSLAYDYYFLRLLAKIKMNTIAATTGGIWRVTSAQLTTVRNACNGILKTKCNEVKTKFNVDVSTLTMSDLQIPLYSGLVVCLFISNSISPFPHRRPQLALLWNKYMYSKGDTTKYVILSNELEQSNDPSIQVTCRRNNVEIPCSLEDLSHVFHEDFQYPCTDETRQQEQYIFSYPNQPGKYFECDSTGKLTIVLCLENESFDAILKRCKPHVSTTPGIALQLLPCVVYPPQIYYPHPRSLSKFILCSQWGQSYELPCPSTRIWHPSIMSCLPFNPSVSVCGANTNGQFQPHPFSSSYFIACGAGTDYQLRKCENNEIWHQDLSQCA
ncbi:oxidative stress-induced growth inhibitor 2-like [Octopus vulgaris]|uniref:Oxidative stress-induced growth inhibitor 2-like n=1 Tax=Octopus vulgaris TaxID=6645 RepID=A0AA36FLW1_OCTVU|nr:oxidative stress-induced growth inhibitor 2-like [Octopus vulgaris]